MKNINTHRKGINTFLLVVAFLFSGNLLQAQNPEVGSITRESPTNQNTNSKTLVWEIQFDKVIDNNSLNTKDFVLSRFGGSTATGNITSITGTGNTYTLTVTNAAGDGALRLDFVGEVSDFNGNSSTKSFEGEHFILDNTKPKVLSIVKDSPATQNTNATAVSFIVTISEAINSATLSTSDFLKAGSPSATISSVTNLGGNKFRVNLTSVSGNGSLSIEFIGQVNDLVGNSSEDIFAKGENYIIDQTLPSISNITRLSPASQRTNSTTLQWTVTFSESVLPSTVEISDFQLSGSPTGIISSISGSGNNFIVTVNNVNGNGNLYLNMSGSVTDLVGNVGSIKFNTSNYYIIDNLNPFVVSISISNPTSQRTNSTTLQWRVNFNENVNTSSVSISDFSLRNTNTTSGTISSVTGSGTTFFVNITNANGDGNIYLDFSGVVNDIADNSSISIYTLGENYILDNTKPVINSVDIRSDFSNPSIAKTGSNVTVRFTVSEAFNIINSQIEGHTLTSDNVFGNTGTVSYIMKSSDFAGNVTFEISITDIAGNTTTFDTTTNESAVEFIKTTPEVIVIENPANKIECEGSIDQFLFAIAAPNDNYFNLAYKWYKDGKPVTSGIIDNGIYNLDTLKYGMSGIYTVEIWAIDGQLSGGTAESMRISPSVYTEPINLYVLQKPSFLKDINPVTAGLGSNITLTFDAQIYGEHNMNNPTYWTQIQWYRGNTPLVDDERYEGTQSSILTINGVQASDYATDYRVRLVGECDTLWSNEFAISEEPYANIKVQPTNVDGCIDDVVQLSIEAESTISNFNLSYQWFVDGVALVDEAGKLSGANTPNLNVTLTTDLAYDGTEEFTCKVWPVGFPDNGATSNAGKITWKSPATITVNPLPTYTAKEGEDITISITAQGDNLSYTWKKDGVDLGVDNDTLVIVSAKLDDAGSYEVSVSNECGGTSRLVAVVITQGPVVTSVDAQVGLGLTQNYPNPFSNNSTISFNSQRSGNATVVLTDMLGNVVANLYNGTVNAGVDTRIDINANNMNLNSGSYFITLSMGDKVETRQISVVR